MRRLATHPALLVPLALAGLLATGLAAFVWAPDAALRLPGSEPTLGQAERDLEWLGYRHRRPPEVTATTGPRPYPTDYDLEVLAAAEPDPAERRRLLRAAPPLRLGVQYRDAVGPEGVPGTLLLEYAGDGRLVGASFGWGGVVAAGLQPRTTREFADRLAERLLGSPPALPEESRLGGGTELIYRPAGTAEGPGVYAYLGGSARWIAHLQPVPYQLLTRGLGRSQRSLFQLQLAGIVVAILLSFGILLWRLTRRRAGFGHTPLLLALLAVGLLPALLHLPAGSFLIQILTLYLVLHAAVLLGWSAAEAELREVRPGSVEHWDRVARRQPVRATGDHLLAGLTVGAALAGLLAASGRLAGAVHDGGGYGRLLVILGDYWLLPSALTWGIVLAVGSAFLVGLGGRVAGRGGAVVGAALSGLAWMVAVPATPPQWALAVGVVAGLVAGWVAWHLGLLALTVAAVTAVSLPAAAAGWTLLPHRPLTVLVSALPLLLLPVAAELRRLAPRHRPASAVLPSYVSELEQTARLDAEVALLRDFQLALLPGAAPRRLPGIDLDWRMIPADTVGGDFLDLVEDADGRLWLAIADAAGHGISCSVMTAFTKAAVAEHAVAGVGPAEALAAIRRLFGRLRASSRTMVTLLLAVWEPGARRLTVATAGHPPLLLDDGRRVREVGDGAGPLGTELAVAEREVSVECPPGSLLVAFSDGVPEAVAPDGDAFGYERWPRLLPVLRGSPATIVLERLLEEVEEHRGGKAADDDVTVAVLRLG